MVDKGDDWTNVLENQLQVNTFMFDFKKAFTPHTHMNSLKAKWEKTLKWMYAFLHFRQQRVDVNCVKSVWVAVVLGVPKGTLLFSLHINDITSDIESEIRIFADCVCYREIKNRYNTLEFQKAIDR